MADMPVSAPMLRHGEADGMASGRVGQHDGHLAQVRSVIGCRLGMRTLAAMDALLLEQHTLFIAKPFVDKEPGAEELCGFASRAAAMASRSALRCWARRCRRTS
jgi:malate dehydrogenase (oxaloacetate-decarboxylating)(NADP+)